MEYPFKFCLKDVESVKYLSLSSTVGVFSLPEAGMTINHVSFQRSYTMGQRAGRTRDFNLLQSSACSLCCLPQPRCGENIRNVWQPVKLPASVPSRQIWLCSSSALPELLPACHTVEEYWLCLSHLWIWNYRMVKNKPDSTGTAAINVNRRGTNFICMEGCFVGMNL